MALTDESGGSNMVMPVGPMGNGGLGGFGGDFGSWIILFLIFGMFGGWGGNGWGGGYGNNQLSYDFPWLMNGQNRTDGIVSEGFQNAATQNMLTGIQAGVTSGFGDVQNSLCGGFAGVNASINGAQGAISQQMYASQIADMERSFAAQTAQMQGMSALQSQLAQCCCDNRLATAQTQAIVQSENCSDRYEAAQNTAAIINAINGGIQSVKDQLCEYRNDQKDETIANLRQELMFSRGQASQVEQTAQLLANNNAQTALFQQGLNNEVDALYNRLNTCPVPAVPVCGKQPIFSCNNGGCGFGM